ncbi:prophage tail fiber N-terminal domain-containing protein [Citrobacter sp. VF227]
MPVLISGILRDGAGKPVQGCTIHLKAKRTSPTVVVAVISSTATDANGHYSIEAEPGYYGVSLLREGFPPSVAGEIYITPTDAPDTLNAFLDAPKDADLRPEVMKRFEEMVNRVVDLSGATEKDRERAEQAAQSAGQSRDSAALSATAAAESQAQAERSAAAADASARSADDNARQTAQDVLDSGANADDAAKSAQSSQNDASRAEQAAQASEHAAGDSARYAESARLSAADADQSRQDAVQSALSAHESERAAAAALDDSARNAVRAENAATEGERSATAAAQSEQAASASARSAATSEQNAATSAGESAQSAEESAESARLAGQHKDAAALSEQGAKSSEDKAAKSAEDAEKILSDVLKTDNNLSEIAESGDEAVAEARKNLQLEAAALRKVDFGGSGSGLMKAVMATGAYGLGGDAVYISSQYNKPFLPGMVARGSGWYVITEITSDRPSGANPRGSAGDLMLWQKCQSSDGKINGMLIYFVTDRYFAINRYQNGFWSGWSQFDSRPGSILLSLRQSRDSEPDTDGIALLAFCGSPDKKTLKRGDFVQGSLLRHVSLVQDSQDGVRFVRSAESATIAGGYVSLSGNSELVISGDEFIVSLFMRIN